MSKGGFVAICIEYVEVEKKKVQVYMNIMTTRTNNARGSRAIVYD